MAASRKNHCKHVSPKSSNFTDINFMHVTPSSLKEMTVKKHSHTFSFCLSANPTSSQKEAKFSLCSHSISAPLPPYTCWVLLWLISAQGLLLIPCALRDLKIPSVYSGVVQNNHFAEMICSWNQPKTVLESAKLLFIASWSFSVTKTDSIKYKGKCCILT